MTGAAARIVVVGASLAGLRSAEAIRKAGYTDELVIVGAEPYLPYNRPPLSKAGLDAVLVPEWLRPNRAIADVTWKLGQPAVAANLSARTLTLGSGLELAWTGLVVATGLRSRHLDLPGPTEGRHVLRDVEDAHRLRFAMATAQSIVIIGAGFIGCEIAALAAKAGLQTHVVAPEAVPIERPLGLDLGNAVRRRLEAIGVEFHLGTVPTEFLGEERATGAALADGTHLDADVIVEAVGSTANTEWLSGNGLDLSDGVLCDAELRVEGRPDVVACGDIARFPNHRYDHHPRRIEHWMTAVDTAKRAGQSVAAHVLGRNTAVDRFAPVPSFWSDQDSIRIQSFGSPGLGGDDIRVLEGDLDGDVAVGYHREGELVGVVLLGLQGRYMHYRRAMEEVGRDSVER